ncbi:MAG: histidine phosphatase family protein [Clostridiales bacterium]|nr:histidine phosphatase family protein [Clostridiales bacterium]
MKTTLIVIRHGFSTANKTKIFSGCLDVELTETGRKQASLAASYLRERGGIDKVYSSDLKRAHNTAIPVAKALELPVILEEGFREVDAGEWEGLPFYDILERYPVEYTLWQEDIGRFICPGGESAEPFWNRILSSVDRIAEENEGKTVVIASHATPIRVMCTAAAGLPLEWMQEIPWVRNASINTFEHENGCLKQLKLDFTDHLGEYIIESTDRL